MHLDATINSGPAQNVMESTSVSLADSVVGMVASTGLPVSIGPEDYHNSSVDRLTGIDTNAMIAVPVYIRSERCGVISAINPAKAKFFSGEDLRRLEWKAYLAGLVLADHL